MARAAIAMREVREKVRHMLRRMAPEVLHQKCVHVWRMWFSFQEKMPRLFSLCLLAVGPSWACFPPGVHT